MEQEKLTNDFKQVLNKFQTASQVAVKRERDTVARDRASSQMYTSFGMRGAVHPHREC